jgi:hypothetical protein
MCLHQTKQFITVQSVLPREGVKEVKTDAGARTMMHVHNSRVTSIPYQRQITTALSLSQNKWEKMPESTRL